MSLKGTADIGPVVKRVLFVFTLVLAALAVSCGPDPLRGHLVLSGSSTLAPLMSRVADQWKQRHPQLEIRVEAIGSDAGLERLIQYNEADVALVSRPLSSQDFERARSAGKELLAIPVAWDAVSLVVPNSNHWALSLTREQAALALTSARLWSDLDARWPAVAIHRFVLGPRSGTSDIVAAQLLSGDKGRLYSGPSVQSSEDDRILARGVAQVEGSVGFLGWTTVREAGLPLRVVALDGVAPTTATIADRSYGLPRQLRLVVDSRSWKQSPSLLFLQYVFDHYAEVIEGTSLIPLDAQERLRIGSLIHSPSTEKGESHGLR